MFYLKDKNVLVTGGTGSLGKSLVPELLNRGVKKIVIYSRNEFAQVEMERNYPKSQYSIRYQLGDIRDKSRLHRSFNNIDVVVNCAALKHIDKSQYDPFETVKTNVVGAQNIIDVAINNGVDKVINIGTDKEEGPVSLYGASKLCATFMFIAANNYSPKKTRFSVVRFGNFWNSSGSIVEMLLNLDNRNNNIIPITDERMTRFFISLDDAASYVCKFIELMIGGEVFIPKMKSKKIVDIIKELQPNCKLKHIGKRPGEKLHEQLMTRYDFGSKYEFKDYYTIIYDDYMREIYDKNKEAKKLNNEFCYDSRVR